MSSSYLPYSRNHSSLVPWSNWVTCENIDLGTELETANLFTCTVITRHKTVVSWVTYMEQVYITVCIEVALFPGYLQILSHSCGEKFSTLELRLSVPDFVSHLIFLQSCKTKSRTESLGSRLISLHSCEIKSWSDLRTRLGQQSIIPTLTIVYLVLYWWTLCDLLMILMDPVWPANDICWFCTPF